MAIYNDFAPLHRQITDSLREIVQKELKSGDKLLTEGELMKKFGVARMTVRQAIVPLLQEGLVYRKRGKGTFVALPQIDIESKSGKRNIGVIFTNIYASHPFITKILSGITEVCNDRHHSLHLLVSPVEELNHKKNVFLIKAITEKHVDGVILADWMKLEDILMLKEVGIPFVWIANNIPTENIHCVISDTVSGTYTLIKHLINLNHRRIGLITDILTYGSNLTILSTYQLALKNHEIDFDPAIVKQGVLGRDTGYKLTRELLMLPERPTAIYTGDDITAIGAIEAVVNSGLKVPDDVAIVGCGDMLTPIGMGLTTLNVKLEEMGKISVDMLLKIIMNEHIDQSKVMVEPELIIRDSCGYNKKTGIRSGLYGSVLVKDRKEDKTMV